MELFTIHHQYVKETTPTNLIWQVLRTYPKLLRGFVLHTISIYTSYYINIYSYQEWKRVLFLHTRNPAIPLLSIYLGKTIIQKDTYTPVFTEALFTIARTWKQPKCPLTDEWIKRKWYIYTTEYHSAIKRSETGSFVEMWMDLEIATESRVSQKEKNKYHIFMHICGI